jgi:hypothetical protein
MYECGTHLSALLISRRLIVLKRVHWQQKMLAIEQQF